MDYTKIRGAFRGMGSPLKPFWRSCTFRKKTLSVIRFNIAAVLVIVMMAGSVDAQNRVEIRGTVTDGADNTPLIGASVVVEGSEEVAGTTIGTVTGLDGTYTINVPEELNTLVFSFVGYITQTVQIDGRTTIDIVMQPDVRMLDDVVVVGYGVQTQRETTGSIVSLSESDFNQGAIASPEQLLQGRTAGVQITTASGEPGAGANVRIRGTSSVRGGNQPLFVVDGVPLSGGNDTPGGANVGAGSQSARNPLTFLNPNDIESISVLKDASAAAIYGARGSNGVILITTKSGASEPTLSISSSTSISNTTRKLDLLSADEYVSMAQAAGADPDIVDFGSATNWQDQIFRTGISQDYNVSYGAGSETGSYRLSLGYGDQQGTSF